MNNIYLSGIIKNIKESHKIGSTLFNKAQIITKRENGQEDIVDLKFKSLSNSMYKDDDFVTLTGNVRSFSEKNSDNKNKVSIYVFTYFDLPEVVLKDTNNRCEIDGRICKINPIRNTKDGKQNIHFIIANNIQGSDNRRLSSYIPCIAWGKLAREIGKLMVNDFVNITGQLHSREHKKYLENGDCELRVAHELLVKECKAIGD